VLLNYLKGNGIVWLQGSGKLLANKQVEFVPHEGATEVIQATKPLFWPQVQHRLTFLLHL
jgi:hypothetical protein